MLEPLVPSKRDRSMAYRGVRNGRPKAARITNNNGVQISRCFQAVRKKATG
jgi:hypothetical protein